MDYSRGTGDVEAFSAVVSLKLLAANLLAFIAASGVVLAFVGAHAFPGIAAGFFIGTASTLWLLRIARKGARMDPEKAGRFIPAAYRLRFAVVAVLLALILYKGILAPWPLIGGFLGSALITVCTTIYLAREEASHA